MDFSANMFPSFKLSIDEESCTQATHLFSISVLPMTLKAAIHLNLLEIISKSEPGKHLSAEEVTTQLPTKNPQAAVLVESILCLLASYNVFTCSISTDDAGRLTRRYGATPICKLFAKNGDEVSLAPLSLINQEKVYMDSWNHMKDAVLEGGIPFNRANGMSLFEYCAKDQKFATLFNKGMSSYSTVIMNKILEHYKGFSDVKVLVDVGGGTGASLNMIVSEHPHIKGINYDLPLVTAEAPTIPGIQHVGGDMFSSVPTGDVILMKWILHNWNDEHSLNILKNCWKALPDKGKVVVVESVLPVVPDATHAAQTVFHLDISMQALFGSKVRTEMEFESLAKEAGFSGFKALFNYSTSWIMEFTK